MCILKKLSILMGPLLLSGLIFYPLASAATEASTRSIEQYALQTSQQADFRKSQSSTVLPSGERLKIGDGAGSGTSEVRGISNTPQTNYDFRKTQSTTPLPGGANLPTGGDRSSTGK